ncbi:MAG: NAD(P)-dependent alcohol dehydrogenase [Nitrospiraceae bacterium]|nr:NAD(P)-dependent alcohol dehydrogenase [Nitrospiraceae bacterium]
MRKAKETKRKTAGTSGAQILKIRAAVLRRPGGPLKIETLELEGPRDDEALVRIAASGICHTDIDFMDGADGPVVLGHEGAGVVERTGKGVRGVKPGDHVVLSYQSCGLCGECRRGHPAGCERFWDLNFGFQRPDGSNALHRSGVRGHFFGQSSFATHVLATRRNIVKVPMDNLLELLAPLGCGIQTGAGTVMNSLHVLKGQSVAVFGTGAVGLAAVMAARIVGGTPVIGVDINPARLKLALELGATDVIDSRREDVLSRVDGISSGGVDYSLEITGDPVIHRMAIDVLKPDGTVALIASPGASGALPGGRKSIGIIQGDSVPQEFIPKLIRLYRRGLFPFDRLIRFYGFRDINRAIRDARSGKTIKPVLRIGA